MTPIASPKIVELDAPALKDVSSNALLNEPSSGDIAVAAKEPSPTPSDVRKVSEDISEQELAVVRPLKQGESVPMEILPNLTAGQKIFRRMLVALLFIVIAVVGYLRYRP
jgi:hypothetical protein